MNLITAFLAVACVVIGAVLGAMGYLIPGAVLLVVAIVVAFALKMANTWQKFVILRAGKFVEPAMINAGQPAALQLRALNIIYETTKEPGTTILIPTSMVDSMNPVMALALAGQDKTAPASATAPPLPGNRSIQQKNVSKVDEPSLARQST